jgi:hypothetical protein
MAVDFRRGDVGRRDSAPHLTEPGEARGRAGGSEPSGRAGGWRAAVYEW